MPQEDRAVWGLGVRVGTSNGVTASAISAVGGASICGWVP